LRALRLKKRLRYFEERIAVELIAAGYARREEDMLIATPRAIAETQMQLGSREGRPGAR
jgi:hypothetical protein